MKFKHFFNTYDTTGQQHAGFLQSMDFSALEESVTFLNELTWAFMDAYLYNQLSESLVMRQWGQYMHYSRENARFEIMSTFYQDFVNAVAAKLMRAEKWYQLTKVDFTALSATDIKTIEHGEKETETEKGQGVRTNVYGQTEDTTVYGATKRTKDYDTVVVEIEHDQDTHVVGQAKTETDNTTTNKLYPLGASDFINDTQQILDGEINTSEQTNTDTWGDQTNTTSARKDEDSTIEHTDRVTGTTHTDTVTDAAKTDTQTIKAYTDTERHTKHIILSPDKYYQIEKELAEIGVYDLMKDVVKETMLLCVWEGGYIW